MVSRVMGDARAFMLEQPDVDEAWEMRKFFHQVFLRKVRNSIDREHPLEQVVIRM